MGRPLKIEADSPKKTPPKVNERIPHNHKMAHIADFKRGVKQKPAAVTPVTPRTAPAFLARHRHARNQEIPPLPSGRPLPLFHRPSAARTCAPD
mgnify:CR=1 FL=1